MTTLATHDLEPNLLDELALIADPHTPLRKPFADKFKAACQVAADLVGPYNLGDFGPAGLINPNMVRLLLLNEPDYNPRQLSALWSSKFLMKTSRPVQIEGEGSRGNTNKSTVWRRWLGEAAA